MTSQRMWEKLRKMAIDRKAWKRTVEQVKTHKGFERHVYHCYLLPSGKASLQPDEQNMFRKKLEAVSGSQQNTS